MSRRAYRAHGRPQPDGPAPFTTLVELTFQKQKVEHWIRFGRKCHEQILDRRRSVVGFAPNSIFAFVRWAVGEHGTIISRIDIVRAIGRGEPFQTLPFVRPGPMRMMSADNSRAAVLTQRWGTPNSTFSEGVAANPAALASASSVVREC